MPPHRQAFPLSGSLAFPPTPSTDPSGILGAPPKMRPHLQGPPPAPAEELRVDELGVDQETGEPILPDGQSTFAKAMLQQTQALGALVRPMPPTPP